MNASTGIYTVLILINIYLEKHQGRQHRPKIFKICLLSLYVLITILTVLATVTNYEWLTSDTLVELWLTPPNTELDDLKSLSIFDSDRQFIFIFNLV
jgi:hypothetical protein